MRLPVGEKIWLKHEQSGKFVHPEGGRASDGVNLVLYEDGFGEDRTGFYAEEKDGYYYLRSVDWADIYVRPHHVENDDHSIDAVFAVGKVGDRRFSLQVE